MSQKSGMKCLNTVWAKRWMIHGNYSLDGGVSMWAAFASFSLIYEDEVISVEEVVFCLVINSSISI